MRDARGDGLMAEWNWGYFRVDEVSGKILRIWVCAEFVQLKYFVYWRLFLFLMIYRVVEDTGSMIN